jgi:hypothetical protein
MEWCFRRGDSICALRPLAEANHQRFAPADEAAFRPCTVDCTHRCPNQPKGTQHTIGAEAAVEMREMEIFEE